jgi:phosphodiesterase/alkaline phosphatase D-like protein
MTLNRREFVQLAAAMGASLAWGGSARASTTGWHERRDLYPEGVASGDPDPSSVILWTRRPFESGGRRVLTVEVAEDDAFRRVVAKASAPVSAQSDWTTRVLIGHLKPARVYWYRFSAPTARRPAGPCPTRDPARGSSSSRSKERFRPRRMRSGTARPAASSFPNGSGRPGRQRGPERQRRSGDRPAEAGQRAAAVTVQAASP